MVVLLGFFAIMRFAAWDAVEPFAVVNALTMVVYLPAWAVMVGAATTRRWGLCGVATLIVAAQLAYVAPELLAATPVPNWARRAPILRLFDANVDKSKRFADGYSPAIERYHPDVVTLEEFTPGSFRRMRTSGVLAHFPYSCSAPRYGPSGFLVASRFPMSHCRVRTVEWKDEPTPYMVSVTVHARGGPVQLQVVHTLAPLPAYWNEWVAALNAVDKVVQAESRRDLLMVGDFNATWDNRGFAVLLSDGVIDAAAARGEPFAMTWPNGALVPPFVRIDHVLTGHGLCVTKLNDYSGFGSDHHYLTATIAVHR